MYLWLLWAFIALHRLLYSSCGAWASQCGALSRCGAGAWASVVWRAGSVVVGCRLSCSAVCGIFLDQESNLCPYIGRQILNHWPTRKVLG